MSNGDPAGVEAGTKWDQKIRDHDTRRLQSSPASRYLRRNAGFPWPPALACRSRGVSAVAIARRASVCHHPRSEDRANLSSANLGGSSQRSWGKHRASEGCARFAVLRPPFGRTSVSIRPDVCFCRKECATHSPHRSDGSIWCATNPVACRFTARSRWNRNWPRAATPTPTRVIPSLSNYCAER